jgi:ubiquinone/menaquinone biosynthesis C-methylase UbiE
MSATPENAATRVAVFRALQPRPGESGLDVGCGPGYLTREFAVAVGAAGRVAGVDLSAPMLGLAAKRCAGLAQVALEEGDAGHLPVADGSVDFASALQVYCYVRDLDEALADLRRSLKPGGRAAILDTDFSGLVWESGDRARMRRVLRAYDDHCAWPDLPRILPARLKKAGLEILRSEAVPILSLSYHPNTYVYGLARFIHQFVTKSGYDGREADAWLAEFDALETEGTFFFAVNRFLFTVTRR